MSDSEKLRAKLAKLMVFEYPRDAYFSELPYDNRIAPIVERLLDAVDALEKIGCVDLPSVSDKTSWIVMAESMGSLARGTIQPLRELTDEAGEK